MLLYTISLKFLSCWCCLVSTSQQLTWAWAADNVTNKHYEAIIWKKRVTIHCNYPLRRSSSRLTLLSLSLSLAASLSKHFNTVLPNSAHALLSCGCQYLALSKVPLSLRLFLFHLLCLSVCALFTQLPVLAPGTTQKISTVSHWRPPEERLSP